MDVVEYIHVKVQSNLNASPNNDIEEEIVNQILPSISLILVFLQYNF